MKHHFFFLVNTRFSIPMLVALECSVGWNFMLDLTSHPVTISNQNMPSLVTDPELTKPSSAEKHPGWRDNPNYITKLELRSFGWDSRFGRTTVWGGYL